MSEVAFKSDPRTWWHAQGDSKNHEWFRDGEKGEIVVGEIKKFGNRWCYRMDGIEWEGYTKTREAILMEMAAAYDAENEAGGAVIRKGGQAQ